MKKVLSILLLLCVVIGALTVAGAEEKKPYIVFVQSIPPTEIWKPCEDGVADIAAEYGADCQVYYPENSNDVNEMNAMCERAIADGATAIVLQGNDPDGQAPAFKLMNEAGVPFCLVNSDCPDSGRLAFIGTGEQVGIVGGQAILDHLGDKPIYAIGALYDLTATVAKTLSGAYNRTLEAAPGGYTLLDEFSTQSDPMTSLAEWQSRLIAYPELNAGYAICGFGASGFANAVKELGLNYDDYCMIGIDFTDETLQLIREGKIYGTMTQNFYRMGYSAAKWLMEYTLNGVEPEQKVNDSGTVLVTLDNIDTFQEELRNPEAWS